MISEPRLYFITLGLLCMVLAYGFIDPRSRAIPGRPASLLVRVLLASALLVAGTALMLTGAFPQGLGTSPMAVGIVTTLIAALLAAAAVCSIWSERGMLLPTVCMSLCIVLLLTGVLVFVTASMPPGSEAGQILTTF